MKVKLLGYLVQRVGVQTLLVLAIVIVGFLLVEDHVARWDLTEDNRFSISEASHRLAQTLEDPLTIRAYFSDNLPPRIEPLQRQVFDILSEYEARSAGKIKVERYDPLETRTAESEAESYGIQPVQLQVYEATQASALQVYGGIVLLYRDRASEVINIAARYPEGYEGLSVLEYEISSKIWQLANEKPKLGLCGYLSSMPPPNPMMMGRQQPRPEFSGLRRVLGDAFEIEEIDLKQEEPDPDKMPLLLVVRPKEFSDVEVFRLDQYLVKGGRVLMLITQGTIQPGYPPPGSRQEGLFRYEPFKTGLDEWLAHHGVRVPNEFVLHQFNALPIRVYTTKEIPNLGQARGLFPEANWFWPTFGTEGSIDRDNPAMQTLKVVHLFWPHPVDILEDKLGGKAATVLLRSHEDESWRWKELTRVDRRHLDAESDGPDPTAFRASPVAVAIEGQFGSYFADKPIPPSLTVANDEEETPRNDDGAGDEESEEKKEGEENKEGEEEAEEKKEEPKPSGPEVVKTSAEPTQLVILGNAFFVSDMVLGGQSSEDSARLAGLLAFNLVDWLARSKDLIALRAKRYARRALLDPDFDTDRESLNESFEKGEIGIDEYKREADMLRERQKNRWKTWRWRNVLWPAILTLLIGALVWILRAAARARRAIVPRAVPPASLDDIEE